MSDVKIYYRIEDLLIEKEKIQEINCEGCLESWYKREIYQCRKGCVFCSQCWKESLSVTSKCLNSECDCIISSFEELSRNRYFESIFNSKLIKCPNTNQLLKDDTSKVRCNQVIHISELENHIGECNYRVVKCINSGCSKVTRYDNLNDHYEECDFVKIKCIYCNEALIRLSYQSHLVYECPSLIIDCSQCKGMIRRSEKKTHVERDCINTIIQCPYGCNMKIKRSDQKSHLDKVNHIVFMNSIIENQSSEIQDLKIQVTNQSNQIKELQDQLFEFRELIIFNKNQNLNLNQSNNQKQINNQFNTDNHNIQNYNNSISQTSSKSSSIISNQLKINFYSTYCQVPFIKQQFHPNKILIRSISPLVIIDNHCFQIDFYANGTSLTDNDFISIYISSLGERANIKFTATIINNSNGNENITHSLKTEFKTGGAGWDKFVSHRYITHGFLSNDGLLNLKYTVKLIN